MTPIELICRYVAAFSLTHMLSILKKPISSCGKNSSRKVYASPKMSPMIMAAEAYWRLSNSFFAPTACDILTTAPIETMLDSAQPKLMKNDALPTAATASLPILPTQNISVMLYVICKRDARMMGSANFIRRCVVSSRVKSFLIIELLCKICRTIKYISKIIPSFTYRYSAGH